MLLQNGDLGPSARAPPDYHALSGAKARGEARSVHAAIETVEGMKLYDPGASADTTLIRWSAEREPNSRATTNTSSSAVSNNAEMAVRVPHARHTRADVFRDIMAKGGGEPTVGSNKGSNKVKYKLNLVLKLFGGIATDDEVKPLKPTRGKENATSSDMGARLVLARSSTCLRWRFGDAYIDAKCPVPPLQPINQHKLKASSVDFRLGDLKKHAKGLPSISTSRRCALGEASTMRRSGHR
ncbi:hypothetical protein RI054_37g141210 [Pseudoscourfieldia marina]